MEPSDPNLAAKQHQLLTEQNLMNALHGLVVNMAVTKEISEGTKELLIGKLEFAIRFLKGEASV